MKVKIVDKLAIDQWEQFVSDCPSGNIFHTPRMLEVFKKTKGYKPALFAAVGTERSPLLLILPVSINMVTNSLCKFNSRNVMYGGVLACYDQDNSPISSLIKAFNNFNGRKNLYTEIRNSTDTSAIHKQLLENGFFYEEYLNYVIDIDQSEEQIFTKISRTHRQCIKKARTLGVSVHEISSKELTYFFNIIQKTYSRIKIPGPDISLFKATYDILCPLKMAKFLMAFKSGKPIGALALLFHKTCAYAWYLGSDEKYFHVYPNHILIWEGIRIAKENGCKKFDFLGAGKPNEEYGVRTFKARFGGQLTNYGRYYHINYRLAFKVCKKLYPIYRKFL